MNHLGNDSIYDGEFCASCFYFDTDRVDQLVLSVAALKDKNKGISFDKFEAPMVVLFVTLPDVV